MAEEKIITNEYNIDRRIAEWKKSDSKLEIYEYLGLKQKDYEKYVETGTLKISG